SLNLHSEPSEIIPGISTTGQIPRNTYFEKVGNDFFLDEKCTLPDFIIDDQALYLTTTEGIIIILGCAHSGIVNTMNYVSELSGQQKIFAVFGGMHLYRASNEQLDATAEAFARYDVKMIGPCHCTGLKALTYFKSRFPGRFVECITGSRFTFEMDFAYQN
ncbi:MBL fold metallo-hydrolase, partial [Candidatus Latescibacterota bacterium]